MHKNPHANNRINTGETDNVAAMEKQAKTEIGPIPVTKHTTITNVELQ